MDDSLNNMFGSSRRPGYTVEEIDEAKKRQKKMGGTFYENLEAIAPEKSGMKMYSADAAKNEFAAIERNAAAAQQQLDSIQRTVMHNTDDINATLRDLTANIMSDFGSVSSMGAGQAMPGGMGMTSSMGTMQNNMGVTQSSMGMAQNAAAGMGAAQTATVLDNGQALEAFAGVADELKKEIYGQDEYIKKLVIAFKRPFVTERDENDAGNSVYITGPACSGKHMALEMLVKELGNRHILASDEICKIDLSLYPSSGEEKLFLQDLYSALACPARVILFENYENCHVSMLTRISDLVTTGECRLSERYVMKNGQLVSVSNALADNTVGSFEANGKYFIFISTRPLDKLAGVMGAPFVNALGDVCTSAQLDEETLKTIAKKQDDLLIEKCKKQLAYEITVDDSFRDYAVAQSSKGRALKGVMSVYSDTQKALAQLRLERDDLESNSITLKAKNDQLIAVCGKEKIKLDSLLPDSYRGEIDTIKSEMDAIVGLKAVKDYIFSLEEYYQVQKRREEEGLKAGEVNKHMIFTGNPGTGKTTIARIVSKYLKAIGVLSGGQLVEVSRGDLVGRYQGHTAPLVNQVVKSAIGGVLFIDEAYSLYRGEDDSFGLEAIDTLVKGIEDNRDNLIVILAGYSYEMEEFLQANSGLKSRFPNIIDFPDYTGEELVEISKLTAKSKGYQIDEEILDPLKAFYDNVQAKNAREAGNGRLVRNKVEEAILNQSRRLVAEPDADMSLLKLIDFELDEK